MENQNKPAARRLYSLDALRGFDMFWIMGGEGIFIGLATLTGWPIFQWWASQLHHVAWHGFHFYDMIFPVQKIQYRFLSKILILNNLHYYEKQL